MISSSRIPPARAVGMRTFGRACLRVRGDCQNTTSRPRAVVNTICERFSRARSRTTSMAAPRRTHDRTAARSTISGACGHSSSGTGWQYSARVRGHVPDVRNTIPPPIGSRSRNGSRESRSGLLAISSSTYSTSLAGWSCGGTWCHAPQAHSRRFRLERAPSPDRIDPKVALPVQFGGDVGMLDRERARWLGLALSPRTPLQPTHRAATATRTVVHRRLPLRPASGAAPPDPDAVVRPGVRFGRDRDAAGEPGGYDYRFARSCSDLRAADARLPDPSRAGARVDAQHA